MRLHLIAALTAVSSAMPAFAQDVAPPPSGPPLGGFRIEALGGYDANQIQNDDGGGILYGLGVGYDFQVGRRAIIGLEAEATETTANGCEHDIFDPGDALCVDGGRDLYAGVRAGFLVGRNVLLYGKAGYTNWRLHVDYTQGNPVGISSFSYGQNFDGIRGGVGAQFGLGPNAYVRTEYRYSNYEDGGDRHQVVGAFGFRF